MYDKARKAIQDSSVTSSVYIGCDSQRFKKHDIWYARYSTVIILHVDSNKGCKLFHDTFELPDFGNLKQRLLNEVMYATSAALEVIDVIGKRHLEIHLDLNPSEKHKSNVAVKEALGYVKGQTGIDATIKPNSFAASHCGDHLVRGKLK
jgi:predicted RNase H-related nuclease YkuK (DUF458 family)